MRGWHRHARRRARCEEPILSRFGSRRRALAERAGPIAWVPRSRASRYCPARRVRRLRCRRRRGSGSRCECGCRSRQGAPRSVVPAWAMRHLAALVWTAGGSAAHARFVSCSAARGPSKNRCARREGAPRWASREALGRRVRWKYRSPSGGRCVHQRVRGQPKCRSHAGHELESGCPPTWLSSGNVPRVGTGRASEGRWQPARTGLPGPSCEKGAEIGPLRDIASRRRRTGISDKTPVRWPRKPRCLPPLLFRLGRGATREKVLRWLRIPVKTHERRC